MQSCTSSGHQYRLDCPLECQGGRCTAVLLDPPSSSILHLHVRSSSQRRSFGPYPSRDWIYVSISSKFSGCSTFPRWTKRPYVLEDWTHGKYVGLQFLTSGRKMLCPTGRSPSQSPAVDPGRHVKFQIICTQGRGRETSTSPWKDWSAAWQIHDVRNLLSLALNHVTPSIWEIKGWDGSLAVDEEVLGGMRIVTVGFTGATAAPSGFWKEKRHLRTCLRSGQNHSHRTAEDTPK